MAVAAMFAMVSCGPSADEKAAAEKATQDSIANAEAEMKAAEEAASQKKRMLQAAEEEPYI